MKPGVAVASAVLMVLRRHESTEKGREIGVHHMGWYSISGTLRIHHEGTMTVTNGGLADVQGQGPLAKGRSEDEAKVGTWGGRAGPQAAIVTVTGFVTGGAKLQCKPEDVPDRSRWVYHRSYTPS